MYYKNRMCSLSAHVDGFMYVPQSVKNKGGGKTVAPKLSKNDGQPVLKGLSLVRFESVFKKKKSKCSNMLFGLSMYTFKEEVAAPITRGYILQVKSLPHIKGVANYICENCRF